MHDAQNTCLNACHTPRKKCACTRACAPMQRCRKFFAMETIANLSRVLCEHRAGCRLPPTVLLSRRKQSPDVVGSRNPSKSRLAHDAVAAAVSHKHHSIIRVGAGLIWFALETWPWSSSIKEIYFRHLFARFFEYPTLKVGLSHDSYFLMFYRHDALLMQPIVM